MPLTRAFSISGWFESNQSGIETLQHSLELRRVLLFESNQSGIETSSMWRRQKVMVMFESNQSGIETA